MALQIDRQRAGAGLAIGDATPRGQVANPFVSWMTGKGNEPINPAAGAATATSQ